MRGIRSNPNRCASAKTGNVWPCVSACTLVGWTSEVFASSPSIRYTASHTPHGMNRENSAM